jgi:hypothetical protein
LVACLAVFLVLPTLGKAATVAGGASVYVWDFRLALLSPTPPSFDSVTISFGQDRLDVGESLRVRLFAGTARDVIRDQISTPTGNGLNGFFWLNEIAARFDEPEGTMVFELIEGTLEIRRLSVILRWNNQRWGASITPAVTLIPEPSIGLLLLSGGFLVVRRSRPTRLAAHAFAAS